jgi:hypothetical protein
VELYGKTFVDKMYLDLEKRVQKELPLLDVLIAKLEMEAAFCKDNFHKITTYTTASTLEH